MQEETKEDQTERLAEELLQQQYAFKQMQKRMNAEMRSTVPPYPTQTEAQLKDLLTKLKRKSKKYKQIQAQLAYYFRPKE